MRVTVIVVAYYGDKWLPRCLDSLARASGERIHLVLVDNAGNTVLEALPLGSFDAEVLKSPYPMGFAEANNFALIHASRLEEAVVFLNQDTISHEGWIDRCIECLERDRHLGGVSPFILSYQGDGWEPDFISCVGPRAELERLLADADQGQAWVPVRHAPAPALMVRMDLLRRVGPFDPIYGSYYEDLDLCMRIRSVGFQVGLCRTAEVRHFSGSTTDTRAKELRRTRLRLRNHFIFRTRESARPRGVELAKKVLWELPLRLAGGITGRPSSHPPLITLKAHWDLLRVADRLAFRRVDELKWNRYLAQLGWPERAPGGSAPGAGQEAWLPTSNVPSEF